MTLTLRVPSWHDGSGSSISVPETAGNPQTGDVRYLITYLSSGTTLTYPTGWTVLANGQVGTSGSLVGIAYRPWVAGVGAQSVTVGATANIVQFDIAVGGVDQAVTPTYTASATATAGTTLTAPGVTPPADDSIILAWYFQTLTSGATTATLSNPTGLTSATTANAPGASGRIGRLSWVENTTGAATGSYVSTASGSGAWAAGLLAVPGLDTGGGTPSQGSAAFLPYLGLGGGVSR